MLDQVLNYSIIMINNKLKIIVTSVLFFGISAVYSQYAPPADQQGTTAIHADSNIFIAWANNCVVDRGYADISNQSLGMAIYGDDESGIDKPDNGVVSLGDGGIAILSFDVPIADGLGWDLAIFENSFTDDFLELAFVEVSSNNINYFRFNSVSLTQQEIQTETFGLTDATKINNLAGKYRGYYGVPFDLSELKNIDVLDIYNITSVRIIDVVGSIDSTYASFDSEGRIINDPWPTPFESSGFDLDGIGIINNRDNTSITEIIKNKGGLIFPNPVDNNFRINNSHKIDRVIISSMGGHIIKNIAMPDEYIDISFLTAGYYIISIYCDDTILTDKLIKL